MQYKRKIGKGEKGGLCMHAVKVTGVSVQFSLFHHISTGITKTSDDYGLDSKIVVSQNTQGYFTSPQSTAVLIA